MFQDKDGSAAPIVWEQVRRTFWAIQGYGLVGITFLSFSPRWFHLQEYLFFSLFVLALLGASVEKRTPWIRTPLDLPLLLFVGWILLTVPFATDPAYSLTEWRKLVAQLLVFYWVLFVFRADNNEGPTRWILAAVVVGTIALCASALVDFVERGGTWRDRLVRAGASSSDYNWLSTYMVIAIPMLIVAALAYRGWLKRVIIGLAVGLAIVTQVVSFTRAGWLGHVAEGLACALMTGRRWLLVWVLGGTVLIGVALVTLSQVGYHRSTVDPWTLETRVAVWKLGVQEIVAHPILGIGYGNDTFVKQYPEYLTQSQGALSTKDIKLPAMHNTFLMVAMGSGIPALVLFVLVFVRMVAILVTRTKQPQVSAGTRRLLIGIGVSITGFAIRNWFDYMFAGSLAYLFWILVAMGLAQHASCTEQTPQPEHLQREQFAGVTSFHKAGLVGLRCAIFSITRLRVAWRASPRSWWR